MPARDGVLIDSVTDNEERFRHAVLQYVLVLHPARHLTIPDLIREMHAGSASFGQHAELECAVRDLVAEGLLLCEKSVLMPGLPSARWPTACSVKSRVERS
jgi:hypothetical protein